MKLGQLIEYSKRNISIKNFTENEAGRLVPDPFLLSKNCLMWGKSKWSAGWFQ